MSDRAASGIPGDEYVKSLVAKGVTLGFLPKIVYKAFGPTSEVQNLFDETANVWTCAAFRVNRNVNSGVELATEEVENDE